MSSFEGLLIVLVAVVMGWFGGGVIWNIQRGSKTLKWMQGGLPALGEKTTMRWLGSSAVELVIGKAKPPFRRVELVMVLEPRDVPWLWLGSHLRGRRDMLIVRGQLNSAPRLEYDLLAPKSWTARPAISKSADKQWGNEPLDDLLFVAPKASLPVSIKGAPLLLENAREIHPTVWRLAIRREFPQLELHVPLPDWKSRDARQFFEALRDLGQQAAKAG